MEQENPKQLKTAVYKAHFKIIQAFKAKEWTKRNKKRNSSKEYEIFEKYWRKIKIELN
jgi:hypothetical protein